MEIQNEINNNLNNEIKLEENKNNFLNTIIGKTINNAIDTGLRIILPDLVENQVIDIKNALFQNGLSGGVKKAIDSAIQMGKSALGIFTGNFENMSQVNIAIGNGGIIDTLSSVLDKTINKIYELGYINKTVNSIMISGKDVLLDNITNNINKELNSQNNYVEKIENYLENWEKFYSEKDFSGMEKEYKNIEYQLKKIIPLESVLKETRKVEILHNLIKNNGHNFELTETEKDLINKFL